MSHSPDRPLPTNSADHPAFDVDGWTVHPSLNRIQRGDESVQLEPRMMHVLVCLATRPGEVLSRRHLLECVWRDQIVGEEALTRSISRLRIAFGDNSKAPRVIETIRGGGYRLVAKPTVVAARPAPSGDTGKARGGSSRRWLAAPVVLVVLLALFLVLRSDSLRRGDDAGAPYLETRPFTTFPGNEGYPDFSPDGTSVVFSWKGADGDSPGVYLKQVGVETPVRLTRSPTYDRMPVFSPDGETVAFARRDSAGHALYAVPAIGGTGRFIHRTGSAVYGLDWAADGGSLLIACEDEADPISRVRRLDLATLTVAGLTDPNPDTHSGDSWLAASPDGTRIAFARCDHAGLRNVWILPLDGSGEYKLTEGLIDVSGLCWMPGGEELVVTASVGGSHDMWRVDAASGRHSRLPLNVDGDCQHPTVSSRDGDIVYRRVRIDLDVVRLGPDASREPLITSTRNDYMAAFSPDGSQIVFVSDRTGIDALWLCDADGGAVRALAEVAERVASRPAWSPRGDRLAVAGKVGDLIRVFIVDLAGRVTAAGGMEGIHQRPCGWSADGRRLLIAADEGETWRLFQVDVDGGGEVVEVPIPEAECRYAKVCGDHVYFSRLDSTGVWRRVIDGGPVELVAPVPGHRLWAVAETDIWYFGPTGADGIPVMRRRLPDGPETQVATLERGEYVDLSVAPGGDSALVSLLGRAEVDLVLVEIPPE